MPAFRHLNLTENQQTGNMKKRSSQTWRLNKTLPNIHVQRKNINKNKQTEVEADEKESTQQNQHYKMQLPIHVY